LHKLDHIIKIKHQNVYKDGFELDNEVDAVFLDLPAPWEALEHAKKAMRVSKIDFSFSLLSLIRALGSHRKIDLRVSAASRRVSSK